MIKRPPFDFETPKDLDAMLHGYIDVLEGKKTKEDVTALPWDIFRMEIFQTAREISGSGRTHDYDEWIVRYYLNGGWKHDLD
jgi:hypothetical protein